MTDGYGNMFYKKFFLSFVIVVFSSLTMGWHCGEWKNEGADLRRRT
jgi:hypothetical protein